ncbi:MAG: chloride channel protein [Acidimicrobiia bacterium]|nr:chloride channel protein [Acidimicrobiia bacterium]
MFERIKLTARQVLHPRGAASIVGLALIVGVLAGLAASALILSIDVVWEWVRELTESDLGKGWFLLTVPAGLLAAWWVAKTFAPEVAGDGVPETMAALAINGGRMPTRSAPWKIIATTLTVGGGGSAGREGPMVQIGASIGSSIGRRFHLGEDQLRALVAAGAGAGIGASFNAPIAGMLFAMEVILVSFSVRHLNSVVVASVAAAVTTKLIVGDDQLLNAIPHRLTDPRELVLYALLGVLTAAAAYVFLRLIHYAETSRPVKQMPSWMRPVTLGLAIALLGLIKPDVLGTGQEFLNELLNLTSTSGVIWWVLLGTAGLKILTTAGTLGAKTSGGAFMPSLFIGGSLGAGLAQLIAPTWSISTLQPGAFAVVGMAATFAAVARAPLTAILIVFEITGDYGLVLPLMLAASLATFIVDRIHPESAYTMPLARRGIRLTKSGEVDLLDTVNVGDVMSANPAVVTTDMTTTEIQGMLDHFRHHGLAVVDGDRKLVGIVTVSDIMRGGGPSDQVTAADVMTPRPITVSGPTPVSVALERMAVLGVGRIPVLDEEENLVGMFRREDAVRAYHLALSKNTDHELRRERLRVRTNPGADFFDFVIPAGSIADGRLVKEVSWPAGLTVVSVRRGTLVTVPNGDTTLVSGDVLTGFGPPGGRERLAERLAASADPEGRAVDESPG